MLLYWSCCCRRRCISCCRRRCCSTELLLLLLLLLHQIYEWRNPNLPQFWLFLFHWETNEDDFYLSIFYIQSVLRKYRYRDVIFLNSLIPLEQCFSTWSWFHQHFMLEFWVDILAPKITKLCFGFDIFKTKISAKSAHKMLMRLTPWTPWIHNKINMDVEVSRLEKGWKPLL